MLCYIIENTTYGAEIDIIDIDITDVIIVNLAMTYNNCFVYKCDCTIESLLKMYDKYKRG